MKKLIFSLMTMLMAPLALAGGAEDISAKQLQQKMQNPDPVLILDVRSAEEYADGHVPDAINISHTELEKNLERIEEWKDREVVVYCRSGRRAGIAAEILGNNGFTNIKHLDGDMQGWRKQGLPEEK